MRWVSLIFILSLTACMSHEMPTESLGSPVSPESEFSAIRYDDRELDSLNSSCPVTGQPLKSVIEPIYVNGRPIGFC